MKAQLLQSISSKQMGVSLCLNEDRREVSGKSEETNAVHMLSPTNECVKICLNYDDITPTKMLCSSICLLISLPLFTSASGNYKTLSRFLLVKTII